MSRRILLFCDGPKSYSTAMKIDRVNNVENDRGHVRHCEIWEKNSPDKWRPEHCKVWNSHAGEYCKWQSHVHHTKSWLNVYTHTHPCGLFYANACNEIIYFSAALWQCYGFKSSGMWCVKGTYWFNLQEWLLVPPLKHLEPLTPHSITFQNIWILINTARRTWNLTWWCYSVSHASCSTVSTSPCTS